MLDIKFICDNPEIVKENIKKKFKDSKLPLVNELIALYNEKCAANSRANDLRANRNKVSKQIGMLMGQGKREEAEEIRISIRSKKGTSANRCAKIFFDGGGHENAAGGKLLMPVTDVEEYIRKYSHIYMTEYEK